MPASSQLCSALREKNVAMADGGRSASSKAAYATASAAASASWVSSPLIIRSPTTAPVRHRAPPQTTAPARRCCPLNAGQFVSGRGLPRGQFHGRTRRQVFGAFGRVNQAAKEHYISAYPPSSAKTLTDLDPAHEPSTASKGPVLRLGSLRFFCKIAIQFLGA